MCFQDCHTDLHLLLDCFPAVQVQGLQVCGHNWAKISRNRPLVFSKGIGNWEIHIPVYSSKIKSLQNVTSSALPHTVAGATNCYSLMESNLTIYCKCLVIASNFISGCIVYFETRTRTTTATCHCSKFLTNTRTEEKNECHVPNSIILNLQPTLFELYLTTPL